MKKNIFKKIIIITSLIFLLVVIVVPVHSSFAQNTGSCSNPLFQTQATCIGTNIWTPSTTAVTQTTAPISTSVYKFLAPLSGDKTFDPSQPNALSAYLNIIIKILISIAAVLAMIMIVIGGIEYMMTDVVSNKAEGKKRITNAIVGLLIALSAYLLLFTINPDLLKTIDASDQTQFSSTTLSLFDYEEELDPAVEETATATPNLKVKSCTGTIVQVPKPTGGSFLACSTISQQLAKLLYDAKQAGLTIGGGGFRTYAEQVSLRIAHCGSTAYEIYQKPSGQCKPPTARPGYSMHESGLAFDFTCNGSSIPKAPGTTNVCFNWLKLNAAKYGLINFAKEGWHWSTTGT